MKIKVCGLKDIKNIKKVTEAGIDFVGMIFYNKSPRFVNDSLSFDEARQINTKKVGVFVNEPLYSVLNSIAHYDLDFVQLHGKESPEYCKEIKTYIKIIKAFGIGDDFDFKSLRSYQNEVDYFLFDTAGSGYGGNGMQFDWDLLKKYDLNVPFFLSGGISEEHIQAIKQLNIKQLYGIDINSKFEISPGLKDEDKIKQFVNELK
jgi:phosphoribosylanthranilate isomerase